jgi:polar amino acid transport system permease protein
MRKLFFLKEEEKNSKLSSLLNILLIVIIIGGVFYFSFDKLEYHYRWKDILSTYKKKFYTGFVLTVILSFFSMILSLIIGIIVGMGKRSHFLPLRYFSSIYIEGIRGTPLIVQIYLFFYVVGTAVHLENRYLMGILIMGIFSGAYVAEIIRAGIESISGSQLETAKALGFSKFQTYRYIVFPQVIKRVMPPMAGQLASLIKDSSLLSVIAVNEFTKNVQEVDSLTFAPIENYLVLAIGYLVLTYPISVLSKKLERRYAYET